MTAEQQWQLDIDQILALSPSVLPEAAQWSADGQLIAFLSTLSGTPELWCVSAQGGFPFRLTAGLGSVRFLGAYSPRWSPDGRWIAYISERSGSAELWIWARDSGGLRQLTSLGSNINALSWSPDSRALVCSSNRHGSYDIFHVSVPEGDTMRLTDSASYEVYPVFTADARGVLFVRLDETWTKHEVVLIPTTGGPGKVIARDERFFDYHYGRTFGYPLVSPDGTSILFRSHRSGFINYWKVALEGGDPVPLCAEECDQSEASWSPNGKSVAYIANHNGTLSLCTVSSDGRSPQVLVGPRQGACAHPQWSPDGSRIAYLFQAPTSPMDLWVTSADGKEAHPLTRSLPGGGVGERLVAPEKVVYESSDGVPIHAYLYRPPFTAPAQGHPGILWIHGGPTSQWFDAFYAHIQYFLQQGYVVLLPNIRGSSGYGRAFEDMNNGDWGHGDLQDAVAGADYLRSLAFVDPSKMAITGTSYGGCLSMSAVCFAPSAFQAAIPMSGYADWIAMYHEQEMRHLQLLRYELGPFETSQDVYRKCSPIFKADQARTPALVIHGEGRPPRSDASAQFVKALEKAYKVVHYKTYPNECYYVRSADNTRQMWMDMRDFLQRYL